MPLQEKSYLQILAAWRNNEHKLFWFVLFIKDSLTSLTELIDVRIPVKINYIIKLNKTLKFYCYFIFW
jgi:hypothetical protein